MDCREYRAKERITAFGKADDFATYAIFLGGELKGYKGGVGEGMRTGGENIKSDRANK